MRKAKRKGCASSLHPASFIFIDSGIAEQIRAHLQLRVLPAQDAGGQGEAARDLEAARAAQAQVLLGAPSARAAPRARARSRPCSRSAPPGYDAAPHLSCVASSREELKAQLERYRASGIRHIVALRGDLPVRARRERRAALRERAGRTSSARRPGDWFHIEVACYPEYHPQTRNGGRRDPQLQAQGRRRRELGDHAVLLQRRRLLPLRRRLRGGGHRDARSCPASCRSATSRSSRASPTRAARRSRAGCGCGSRATATTPPRSAPSGSMSSRACATTCCAAARRGCTSTRSTRPGSPRPSGSASGLVEDPSLRSLPLRHNGDRRAPCGG